MTSTVVRQSSAERTLCQPEDLGKGRFLQEGALEMSEDKMAPVSRAFDLAMEDITLRTLIRTEGRIFWIQLHAGQDESGTGKCSWLPRCLVVFKSHPL